MDLTYDKLIAIDLVEGFEKTLLTKDQPEIILDFFNTIQEIKSINQSLKALPIFPGSTKKILKRELMSAIQATLAIDGIMVTEGEIEGVHGKTDPGAPVRRKEQEVENTRNAYRYIIETVKTSGTDFKYNADKIKSIHKHFTENINYFGNIPGQYRSDYSKSFRTQGKLTLCTSRSETDTAMYNLINWLNREGTGILSSSEIVKAIMAHYYLTEIHPFGDGNGLTARALEAMILLAGGFSLHTFWSLVNFWNSNRENYIYHLNNIRSTCNPWEFILWGLKGFLEEIRVVKGRVYKKSKQLMLVDYAKYLLENKKREGVTINQRIIDVLSLLVRRERALFNDFFSSPEVKAHFRTVSKTTKYRDFKNMEILELVSVVEGGKGFYIEPNYRILERPDMMTLVFDEY